MRPHQRNDLLCELVPLWFCAVSEGLVLQFSEVLWRAHDDIFRDSLERHLLETRSLMRGVAISFCRLLSANERAIYEWLGEREKTAFRILKSLSCLKTEGLEPGTFYIGTHHLGERMGLLGMTARRVLSMFEKLGVIGLIDKGQRWEKGKIANASSYRWLLGADSVIPGEEFLDELTSQAPFDGAQVDGDHPTPQREAGLHGRG